MPPPSGVAVVIAPPMHAGNRPPPPRLGPRRREEAPWSRLLSTRTLVPLAALLSLTLTASVYRAAELTRQASEAEAELARETWERVNEQRNAKGKRRRAPTPRVAEKEPEPEPEDEDQEAAGLLNDEDEDASEEAPKAEPIAAAAPAGRSRRRRGALPPGVRPVVAPANLTDYERLLRGSAEDLMRGVRLKPVNTSRIIVHKDNAVFGEKMRRRGGWDEGEDIEKLFPPQDLRRDMHERCAVVGNGGSLLERKAGRVIDTKYDAVLRYNNAVVEGFEQFVGRKTTYRAINNQWTRSYARAVAKRGGKGRDPLGNTALLCFGNGSLRLYLRIRREFPERVAYYAAPELTAITRAQYKRIHVRMEGLGFGPYPGGHVMPSGVEGILIMLQICKSLDVYGFDPPPPPPAPEPAPGPSYETPQARRQRHAREAEAYAQVHGQAYKYHYFDGISGSSVHSFSFQFDFLHVLHLVGIINLCHGPPHIDAYVCPEVPLANAPATALEGLWSD